MEGQMTDQATVDQMRACVGAILPAVEDEDLERISSIYRTLQESFQVDAPHAVAMILAEQINTERRQWRERLLQAQGETLRFQEAYLDEKRRVNELRALLDRRAAAVPTKPRTRKEAG